MKKKTWKRGWARSAKRGSKSCKIREKRVSKSLWPEFYCLCDLVRVGSAPTHFRVFSSSRGCGTASDESDPPPPRPRYKGLAWTKGSPCTSSLTLEIECLPQPSPKAWNGFEMDIQRVMAERRVRSRPSARHTMCCDILYYIITHGTKILLGFL